MDLDTKEIEEKQFGEQIDQRKTPDFSGEVLQIRYTLKAKNYEFSHLQKVTKKNLSRNRIDFQQIAEGLKKAGTGYSESDERSFLMDLLLKIQFLEKQIAFNEVEEKQMFQANFSTINSHNGKKQHEKKTSERRDEEHTTNASTSPKMDFEFLSRKIKTQISSLTFFSTPDHIQKRWYYFNEVEGNVISCKKTGYFDQKYKPQQKAYYQLISQERISPSKTCAFGFIIRCSYNGSIIIGITHQSMKERRKSYNSGLAVGYEGSRARVYGSSKKHDCVEMGRGFHEGSLVGLVVNAQGKKAKISWYVNGIKEAEVQKQLLDKNYYPYIQTSFEGDQVQFFAAP